MHIYIYIYICIHMCIYLDGDASGRIALGPLAPKGSKASNQTRFNPKNQQHAHAHASDLLALGLHLRASMASE